MKVRYFLLATFLLLSTATVYAQSQGPAPGPFSQHNQGQAEGNRYTDHREYVSGNPTIQTDRNINAKKSKQTSEESTKQGDNRPTYDWGIWVFTGVIAIFSIVQAWALIYQYRAMREQVSHLQKTVEATEKAAEAARKSTDILPKIERAYLFVTQVGHGRDQPDGAEIVMRLKNEGKTPAVVTQIYADYIPGGTCPEEIDKTLSVSIKKGTIISGGAPYNEIVYFSAVHLLRPRQPKAQTLEGQLTDLIFYGLIEYEDVFQEGHTVRFCWHKSLSTGEFHQCSNRSVNYYT